MIKLDSSDIRIISEGEQVKAIIERKYTLENFYKIIGLNKAETLIRYLQNKNYQECPLKIRKLIRSVLQDELNYMLIEEQLDFLINVLELNIDKYLGDDEIFEKLIDISVFSKVPDHQIQALILFNVNLSVTQYNNALKNFSEIKINNQSMPDDLHAKIALEEAYIYIGLTKYEVAINTLKETILKHKQIDTKLLARMYHMSALSNYNAKEYEGSERDYKEAYKITQDINKRTQLLNMIGVCQLKKNKVTKARRTLGNALEMATESKDIEMLLMVYNGLFDAWDNIDGYADLYSRKALEFSKNSSRAKGKRVATCNRVYYELKYGDIELAKSNLRCLKETNEVSYADLIETTDKVMAEIKKHEKSKELFEIIDHDLCEQIDNAKTEDIEYKLLAYYGKLTKKFKKEVITS